MDRFRWCADEIEHRGYQGFAGVDEEALILSKPGVRLYDGPNRTEYEGGVVKLTTHRLLWVNPNGPPFLALPLAAIISARVEDEGGGRLTLFHSRTPKLVLKLLTVPALVNVLTSLAHPMGWVTRWHVVTGAQANDAGEHYVQLGFTQTGHLEFHQALLEALKVKLWAASLAPSTKSKIAPRAAGGVGIGAIQRERAAKAGATDRAIEEAFDDLNQLKTHASKVVQLAKSLARRAAQTNTLSSDETAQMRAVMLSMGVVDSAEDAASSRQSTFCSTTTTTAPFHVTLAHQLSELMLPLLTPDPASAAARGGGASGGACVDLASAYCRLNRARGMQAISPDDLLRACRLLEQERLPIRLKRFHTGLAVIQLATENEAETLAATAALVRKRNCLSAQQLSRAAAPLSVLLARERLLAAEQAGLLCRDDTELGLYFYPNRFTDEGGGGE